jgi:hypothetical protein
LLIDARVIAPEGAHANHRNVDRGFATQRSAPEPRNNVRVSQFQPPAGKRKAMSRA